MAMPCGERRMLAGFLGAVLGTSALLLGLFAAWGRLTAPPPPRPGAAHIVFSGWGGMIERKVFRDLVAEFVRRNPAVDVEYRPVPRDYMTKLKLMFAGGTPPDVFYLPDFDFPSFATAGRLYDIQPHVDRSQVVKPDQFWVSSLRRYRYRWTRLREGRRLRTAEGHRPDRDVREPRHPAPGGRRTAARRPPADLGRGRRLLERADPRPGRRRADRPVGDVRPEPGVGRLEQRRRLPERGRAPLHAGGRPARGRGGRVAGGPPDAGARLAEGAASAVDPGRHDVPDGTPGDLHRRALDGAAVPARAVPLGRRAPSRSARGHTSRRAGAAASASPSSSSCRNPEAAWRLVEFLGGPEGQAAQARTGFQIPSQRWLAHTDVFLQPGKEPAHNDVFIDAARWQRESPGARTPDSEWWDRLNQALAPAYRGETTAAEALRAARGDIQAALDRGWEKQR